MTMSVFDPYEDDPDATSARTPTISNHPVFRTPDAPSDEGVTALARAFTGRGIVRKEDGGSYEPLTWVVIHRLLPILPVEKRTQARKLYKALRRNLSRESSRRAVAYQIVLATEEMERCRPS